MVEFYHAIILKNVNPGMHAIPGGGENPFTFTFQVTGANSSA
ncbi:MAG: hypothetical protein ACTHMC_12245 [Pseudobacter sp.]